MVPPESHGPRWLRRLQRFRRLWLPTSGSIDSDGSDRLRTAPGGSRRLRARSFAPTFRNRFQFWRSHSEALPDFCLIYPSLIRTHSESSRLDQRGVESGFDPQSDLYFEHRSRS